MRWGTTEHALFNRTAVGSLIVGGCFYGLAAAQKRRGATPLVIGGVGTLGAVWFFKKNPTYLTPRF